MARRARIRFGTAGWAVPRALADQFGPEGSALVRYAQKFRAAEINSTFWRRHRPDTFARWRASVPRGFQFAVKLPRTITHEAELRGTRPLLIEFFRDVAGLGQCLGPLLIQLPPSLQLEPRPATAFFRTLRSLHGGPVACEPRHASWFTTSADELLASHDVARVAADPPRVAGGDRPGGAPSLVYFRLHGSPVIYRSAYGEQRLVPIAAALRSAARTATSVWCVFDNTASGAGAGDALALGALLAGVNL